MKVARFFVFVKQEINGLTFEEKTIVYNTQDNLSLMVTFNRMDCALYRASGAILPNREWRVEQLEL